MKSHELAEQLFNLADHLRKQPDMEIGPRRGAGGMRFECKDVGSIEVTHYRDDELGLDTGNNEVYLTVHEACELRDLLIIWYPLAEAKP